MSTLDPDTPASDRPDLFDRVATRIGDLDSPFYDEERDRDVWNEASAVGFQAMLFGMLAACSAAVWIAGSSARPYVTTGMLVTGGASLLVVNYALRRGVDGGAPSVLAASPVRVALAFGLVVVLAVGLFTDGGRSLGPFESLRSFDLATVAGMVTGAGLVLGVAAFAVSRSRRRAPAGDDDA